MASSVEVAEYIIQDSTKCKEMDVTCYTKPEVIVLATDFLELRAALVGLVGCESMQELDLMEAAVRVMPAPDVDKVATINAIQALKRFC